jgi:hypothetical protein
MLCFLEALCKIHCIVASEAAVSWLPFHLQVGLWNLIGAIGFEVCPAYQAAHDVRLGVDATILGGWWLMHGCIP